MKKGQITIFILVGIVILIIFMLVAFLGSEQEKAGLIRSLWEKVTKQQLDPVEEHVQECIKDVGMNGLQILGTKGGYIYSKDKTLELPDYNIAYYDRNEKLLTSEFSKELKRYMDEKLNLCLEFTKFTDKIITVKQVNSVPTITKKGVSFTLKDYDLTTGKGNTKTVISSIDVTIPVRLYETTIIGNKIIEKECFTEDEEFISNDLPVYLDSMREGYNIYSIKDLNYTFSFGVKC